MVGGSQEPIIGLFIVELVVDVDTAVVAFDVLLVMVENFEF